jgi:hypothetical protein
MRVGRARALTLGVAVMVAAALAASLLVLAVATSPAEAAFPGSNGAIAFDDSSQVFRMNSDGSGETNLTNHAASDREPAFFPDHHKIAFASNRDGGDSDIFKNSPKLVEEVAFSWKCASRIVHEAVVAKHLSVARHPSRCAYCPCIL